MQASSRKSLCLLLIGLSACAGKAASHGNQAGSDGNGKLVPSAGSSAGGVDGDPTSNKADGGDGSNEPDFEGFVPSAGQGGTGTGTGGGAGTGGVTSSNASGGDDGNEAGNGGFMPSVGGSRTDDPAVQECLDKPVTCLDEDTAFSCNPDTLMDESFGCEEGVEKLGPGLISKGCVTDASGSGCDFDFADTACEDGAQAFAACYRAATREDLDDLEAYFACFSDKNGLKASIRCYKGFVDANAATVDCSAAENACFQD